ncbi:unnamed protein product [Pieris macdunnoughi]|uniref:Uncharacterized protein n=1 Tax=Pieris macdunnoughi TaxID=345717 RepID=A0A821XN28_9NEOP|nr:unnamed protein product [Pieris macdunnoughi]
MAQNGGGDFGAILQGAGKQIFNQGGQALLNYGAQALGNIINEVFQKKEAEQKRFLPSIKNYKVSKVAMCHSNYYGLRAMFTPPESITLQ